MKSVRWLSFLNPDRANGTIIHFLAATPGAATPYPVALSLTLFGRGATPRALSIDGARLFHPDGVKVEDLFAISSAEADSLNGLVIDIFCHQARADVSASQCIVEFISKEGSVKYSPKRTVLRDANSNLTQEQVVPKEDVSPERVAQLIRDSMLVPSLVVVNGLETELRPEIFTRDAGTSEKAALPLGQIGSCSVVERKLDGAAFADVSPHEMSWGNIRSRLISVNNDDRQIASYVLYRDSKTTRISSIQAL